MNTGKRTVTVLSCLVLLATGVIGYNGTGNTGYTSSSLASLDDSERYPGITSPDLDYECNNTVDDDIDGRTDLDDNGCVRPDWLDRIEGNGWDTDLTSTYLQIQDKYPGPIMARDPTVFFEGEVRLGGETLTDNYPDQKSGLTLNETYINNSWDEGEEFGKAIPKGVEYTSTSFADGTVFDGDRLIDPPNTATGDVVGSYERCGNGALDDGGPFPGDIKVNDTGEPEPSCKGDYGWISSEFWVRDPYNQGNMENYKCEDDNVFSVGSNCPSANCVTPHGAKNTIGTIYYEVVDANQKIKRWECEDDGAAGSVSSDKDCTTAPDGSTTCSCDSEPACQAREWDRSKRDCNNYNRIAGGGDTEVSIDYTLKPDNDPAATYTDFKGYGDFGRDEAWCQFERTLTVDADGPNGNGDGWVLVNESSSSVIATMAPNGSDVVGQNIWARESTPGNNGTYERKNLQKFDFNKDCPKEKTICLKYVDYRTADDLDGWGGQRDISVTDSTIKEPVESYVTRDISADESYSVCKKINQIAVRHGPGYEILDCDYMKGGNNVSPLPEACGDQPKEHLILTEGPEFNYESVEDFLAFNQVCVDYSGKSGNGDKGIQSLEYVDENACVLRGLVYKEGAIANLGKGFQGINSERGGFSPDKEVCLDLNISTSYQPWDNREYLVSERDYGGEWYDLDDGRINDRAQEVADPDTPVNLFIRKNPNPDHPEYNPEGRETGLPLETDCANQRFDTGLECEDTGKDDGIFFSFFEERVVLPSIFS